MDYVIAVPKDPVKHLDILCTAIEVGFTVKNPRASKRLMVVEGTPEMKDEFLKIHNIKVFENIRFRVE